MIKKYILLILLVLLTGNLNAEAKNYKMVFVPASGAGDERSVPGSVRAPASL